MTKTCHTHLLSGVGNATMAQFRILGGAFAISIATVAATPFIETRLLKSFPSNVVEEVLDRTGGISRLPMESQDVVRGIFADGYNLQMRILIGIAAAHIPATLLMWTKKPIIISKKGSSVSSTSTETEIRDT